MAIPCIQCDHKGICKYARECSDIHDKMLKIFEGAENGDTFSFDMKCKYHLHQSIAIRKGETIKAEVC